MSEYKLYLGDFLEIVPSLPTQSVDAIITDLPYGTTACSWDEIIPFAPMWAAAKHVLKPRGVFVTTASQPFTSKLVMSNLEWFRYEVIWDKLLPTGFLNASMMPLKVHENIEVFSDGAGTYNPQLIKRNERRTNKANGRKFAGDGGQVYGAFHTVSAEYDYRQPVTIFCIPNTDRDGLHPTQKPVALYSYLIQTYTNPGDTVLDITMGSGTTGCAAMITGRNFIGVELREDYFAIAEKRIKDASQQILLPFGDEL